jgi:uncharacterized protein YndB with AHSA1/START domain
MTLVTLTPDPKLDLVLERELDAPVELLWKCWTTPEHLMQWFCPLPWKTVACEIDLRPGGRFFSTMQSPEGQQFPNVGCYLEIIPNKRLVWTNALLPGYRPAVEPTATIDFLFTAALELEAIGKKTRYRAIAIHRTEADTKTHADMGFQDGWGTVADQLVAYVKKTF